jgi:Domain of unknown function (DUF4157)
MRTHDTDNEAMAAGRSLPPAHESEAGDRAARALADGRPSALDASAMLHLQASAGNMSVSRLIGNEEDGPRRVRDVLSARGGKPLEPDTAQVMSQRLGHDFSDVRVHTDSAASESARAVNAHAYTVGSDIVFQSDRYAPDTDPGRRTLAHELTHVVQQRSGPVAGTPVGGGMRISHPSDSFERAAEHSADQVMAGGPAAPAAPTTAPSVQRQAPEEEEVQGEFVQRQAPEEEEAGGAGFMAQRQAPEEEEVQGEFVQRQAPEEEEAGGAGFMAQRQAPEEEEEPAKA